MTFLQIKENGVNDADFVNLCYGVNLYYTPSSEVMDAHLQNNQTAEDHILASPDRLKGRPGSALKLGVSDVTILDRKSDLQIGSFYVALLCANITSKGINEVDLCHNT